LHSKKRVAHLIRLINLGVSERPQRNQG
jgi:hypothetical protein